MRRLHARQDVYLDGVLTWEGVMVIEDSGRNTLRVKKSGVLAEFTNTSSLGLQGATRTWGATDSDGNPVEVASAGRLAAGCVPCTGGR